LERRTMIRTLAPKDLRCSLPSTELDEKDLLLDEKDRHGRPGARGQERGLSALELGLGIRERGFNIFVVGASGTGRTSTVEKLLGDKATKENTPDDVVLLYNFTDRDRPHSVVLPSSYGPKLKKSYGLL